MVGGGSQGSLFCAGADKSRRIKKISHSGDEDPISSLCWTVEQAAKNKTKREQPEHRSSFQQQNIRKRFLSLIFTSYEKGKEEEEEKKYKKMPHGNLAPSVSFMRQRTELLESSKYYYWNEGGQFNARESIHYPWNTLWMCTRSL